MTQLSKELQKRLSHQDTLACRRTLRRPEGIDFSSNNYLGFCHDPVFLKTVQACVSTVPAGASGSRLLRGNLEIYDKVEKELAQFCGAESSLIFATGYQANVGVLSALLKPGDCVFSDQHNHASIIDGIKLSGAKKEIFSHLDCVDLREKLIQRRLEPGLKVIVTESYFGMDGDFAPLQRLSELAEEFSALLIVDEAHATGIWGDRKRNLGAGLVQSQGLSQKVFATIHPAGKALGVGGAWVCGSSQLRDYLINFSRPFIFSTAPLPMTAVFIQAAVSYWKEVGQHRALELLEKSEIFSAQLRQKGFYLNSAVNGPIIPIVIGDNQKSLNLANALQSLGYDIRAIRPPAVPVNQSRLRLTLHWENSKADLEKLVCDLYENL